jgi:hypothetical protein
MSILDKTLDEMIDEYCLQHALKNDDVICAIYDAKQLALECDDHLKCELNHKILNELMKSYKNKFLEDNKYVQLFAN